MNKKTLSIKIMGKRWTDCSLEERRIVRLAGKKNSDAIHYNERYKKLKIKYDALLELKGNECKLCKYNKNKAALDFHHRNPEDKKFPIYLGSMCRSMKSLIEEAEKCDLLCCRCHREIHNPN